jgi:ADP-ribose pyrophosphatase YjhB (NUDIX family)
VLLQRRRRWGNHGSTWGPPGGARDSQESAAEAALREAAEEVAAGPRLVDVHGLLVDDHGGWAYTTVLGTARSAFPVRVLAAEISEARWVSAGEVGALDLHPGFAGTWPVLRTALEPLTIIVDAANVMGSRPDGWWRDRAGAARRLRDQLAGLAAAGIPALPPQAAAAALDRWFPRVVLVVEGAASPVAASGGSGPRDQPGAASAGRAGGAGPGEVLVVAAPGSGDDLIASLAGTEPGRRLVITADRELRARCEAAGAAVAGPGWLLGQLP